MPKSDASESLRRAIPAASLALLLAAFCCAAGARAQSGRKAPKTSAPPPPAAQATPQGESESESGPKKDASKKSDALVSLVVMWADELNSFSIDARARDDVAESFMRRLGQSNSVSVSNGGRGRRQEARDRAKSESTAYVVLFELEDEAAMTGRGGMGQSNTSSLVLKTYVYTPKAGDLKYVDTIYQRPYQQTARIGGVRVPVPTRGIERYPSQRELEQAARDAADRVLARFHVMPPPDR